MYKKTNEKKEKIVDLYKDGVMLTEICKLTSSSQATVKKVLLHAGIDYDKERKVQYQQKLDKSIEMYNQGIPQIEIEKELNLTRKTIRTLLKNCKEVKYRSRSEQAHIAFGTEIDHTVFDELTEESLYWLGMLYTDGSVTNTKEYNFELVLQNNDREHLLKFKEFLKTNRDIKLDHGECSRLRVNSKHIVNRLIELGITPNKSKTAKPHDLLKNSRDFWRGCIDGDGGLYAKSKSYRSQEITLCGTLETIFDFIIFLNEHLDINSKYPSYSKGENLYQIHYYGQECKKVADLLYKDAQQSLERKNKIYKKL